MSEGPINPEVAPEEGFEARLRACDKARARCYLEFPEGRTRSVPLALVLGPKSVETMARLADGLSGEAVLVVVPHKEDGEPFSGFVDIPVLAGAAKGGDSSGLGQLKELVQIIAPLLNRGSLSQTIADVRAARELGREVAGDEGKIDAASVASLASTVKDILT